MEAINKTAAATIMEIRVPVFIIISFVDTYKLPFL
jgi:hypothetical protein